LPPSDSPPPPGRPGAARGRQALIAPLLDAPSGASLSAQAAPASDKAYGDGYYIVVLDQAPVALYEGEVPGLAPTNPSVTGAARLDVASATSVRYADYLDSLQRQFVTTVERKVGRTLDVKARYRYALNGMAVWLTADEAARVAAMPGVVSVTPNIPSPSTPTPARAGSVPRPSGAAPPGHRSGHHGEGIVVGVVDTGINIDHPSFAEVDKNGYEHLNPRSHYYGFCDPANPRYDAKWKCNQKLIGLYSFIDEPSNAWNPEDDNGHGSHTSSTAAGNFVTAPYIAPTITLNLEVSGVAPHANIIAYDACFTTPSGTGSCPPAATLAALDQAVQDQVDVVNYSISTSQGSPWTDRTSSPFAPCGRPGSSPRCRRATPGPRQAPWQPYRHGSRRWRQQPATVSSPTA